MQIPYEVSGSVWTPITNAGESGTCWQREPVDWNYADADIRIIHTQHNPESIEPINGKRVYRPNSNKEVVMFSADNGSDVYYARCARNGEVGTIIVDAS
jgi:hypothetical protein